MKKPLSIACLLLPMVVPAAASAQSKFSVLLGGDAFFNAGYVDDETSGESLRDTEFENRFRLNIVPSAKADNGLEYGGRIRIRAASGNRSTDADLAYIFVTGGFGTLRLGTQNGASDEWGVIGPLSWGTEGGVDGRWSNWVSPNASLPTLISGNLRTLGSGESSTRINYKSASLAGFNVAGSFSTVATSSATNVNRNPGVGTFENLYEVGLQYSGEFGNGLSLAANVFYSGGETQESTTAKYEDVSSVMVGGQVGYSGFTVGGFYSNAGDSGYQKGAGIVSTEDSYVWGVSASYTTGPLLFGAGYSYGADAGSQTIRGERTTELVSLGVTYTVAPGFRVVLEYNHYDSENEGTSNDRDGNIVLLGTYFTF